MSTSAIRQKLHNYLEVADDKKIKAIYTIIQSEVDEHAIEYSDKFKKELDKRYDDYKNGKAKMLTAGESKKRIQKILKPGSKK